MSFFDSLSLLPEDPILSIPGIFAADPRESKVNLSVGAYRTAEGKPLILSSVIKAEELILETQQNKEYLPIEGDRTFVAESLKLIFGEKSPLLTNQLFFAAQTVGGSGALRIGGEFLAQQNIPKTLYLSQPTWPNHRQIFQKAGFNLDSYPYYDFQKHLLDFSGMCFAITNMPPSSVIVLHGCCHNPTGMDPSLEQWKELSFLMKKKEIIPFFDLAYQGFGENLEQDVAAIRYFSEQGHSFLLASSYSKNFGLYDERIGLLVIATHKQNSAHHAGSHIKQLIRSNYSNPPAHGGKIVGTILKSQTLREEWRQELSMMRHRVSEMRQKLSQGLREKCGTYFEFLEKQHGIFSFTGLNPQQVDRLRQEYGIYMPQDGRINVAGLTHHNINYVINSIHSAIN